MFREFGPDAIVHYGEMPSAPYSMIDREHAVFTQTNNVVNTLNVLYAMAEITPTRTWSSSGRWASTARRTSTSRRATSRSSTTGVRTRSRSPSSQVDVPPVQGARLAQHPLRVPDLGAPGTDLNQVVYGIETDETRLDERLLTRFDYDEVFGTALNRFCLQAVIGQPLTPTARADRRAAT